MKKHAYVSFVYSVMFLAAVALVFVSTASAEESDSCTTSREKCAEKAAQAQSGCCPFLSAQSHTASRSCGDDNGDKEKAACTVGQTSASEVAEPEACEEGSEYTTTASRADGERSESGSTTFAWPFRTS